MDAYSMMIQKQIEDEKRKGSSDQKKWKKKNNKIQKEIDGLDDELRELYSEMGLLEFSQFIHIQFENLLPSFQQIESEFERKKQEEFEKYLDEKKLENSRMNRAETNIRMEMGPFFRKLKKSKEAIDTIDKSIRFMEEENNLLYQSNQLIEELRLERNEVRNIKHDLQQYCDSNISLAKNYAIDLRMKADRYADKLLEKIDNCISRIIP